MTNLSSSAKKLLKRWELEMFELLKLIVQSEKEIIKNNFTIN